jgi:hypothetical protein
MFHTIFIVLILTKYLLHIRYKLKFLASDGTETAEMFCFNNVARQIVGKSCEIVLRGVSEHSPIPPDLAQIISLKFTFRVTVDDQSFFQKKTIIQTCYESTPLLLHMEDNGLYHCKLEIFSNKDHQHLQTH